MQIRTDSKGKVSLKSLPKPLKPYGGKSSSKGPAQRLGDKRDYLREFKNSLNSILSNYQNKRFALATEPTGELSPIPRVPDRVRTSSTQMAHNFSQKNLEKAKPEPSQGFVSLPKKKSRSTASLKTASSAIFENYFKRSPQGPSSQIPKRARNEEAGPKQPTMPSTLSSQNVIRLRREESVGGKPPFSSTNGVQDIQLRAEDNYTRPNFFKPMKPKAVMSLQSKGLGKLANIYSKPSSVPKKAKQDVSPMGKNSNIAPTTTPTSNVNTDQGDLKNFVTSISESKLVVNLESQHPPQRSLSQKKLSKKPAKLSRPYFFDDLIEAHTLNKCENYFHSLFKMHMTQTLQSMLVLSRINLKDYTTNGKESVIEPPLQLIRAKPSGSSRPVSPPSIARRKTIIFDLDETLIHCNEDQSGPADIRVPVIFPSGEKILAGINVRPFAKEVIEELAAHFEVIIFTASHSCYANPVIDYLDEKRLIAGRLFREHCSQVAEGLYTKDLRVIKNRDLKDLVLVDNAVYSFILNLENGIPIIPYYNNKKDAELLKLKDFLMTLKDAEDVRPYILSYFEWDTFATHGSQPDKLFKKLFDN